MIVEARSSLLEAAGVDVVERPAQNARAVIGLVGDRLEPEFADERGAQALTYFVAVHVWSLLAWLGSP